MLYEYQFQGLRAFSPVTDDSALLPVGDLLLPSATRNVVNVAAPPTDNRQDKTGSLELSFGQRQDPDSPRVKKDSPEKEPEFGARLNPEGVVEPASPGQFQPPAKLEMFSRDEVVIPSILPKHPPLQLQPHLYNRPPGVPPPPDVRRPKLVLAEERPPRQRKRRPNSRFRQSRHLRRPH